MKASTERILITHVGSLPRSQAVTDVLFARERGEATDAAGQRDDHRSRARRRAPAGRSGRRRGQRRRDEQDQLRHVHRGSHHRFAGDTPREPGQDLVEFPRMLKKLAESGATAKYRRPRCVGEIRVRSLEPAQADVQNIRRRRQRARRPKRS